MDFFFWILSNLLEVGWFTNDVMTSFSSIIIFLFRSIFLIIYTITFATNTKNAVVSNIKNNM